MLFVGKTYTFDSIRIYYFVKMSLKYNSINNHNNIYVCKKYILQYFLVKYYINTYMYIIYIIHHNVAVKNFKQGAHN